MKHLLLPIALLFTFAAKSQKFYAEAGVTFAKLHWASLSQELYAKADAGFYGAVGVEFKLQKYFALNVTGGYLSKAGSEKVTYTDAQGTNLGTVNNKASFNYATLEAALRFKIPSKGSIYPFLTAGAQGGYLVSTSGYVEKDGFEKIDICGVIGAGAGYKFGKKEVGLTLKFLPSFNKLLDYESYYGNSVAKPHVFSIGTFICL